MELANIVLVPSPLRTVVQVAIVISTGLVMTHWVAANRAGLDLTEWCGCARERLAVRVVERPAPRTTCRPEAPAPALETTAGPPRA